MMGSVTKFLYKTVLLVVGFSLFSVSGFLLPFFRFISSFLFRLHGNGGGSLRQKFENSEIISSNHKDFKCFESEPELVPEPKPEPEPEPEPELNDVGLKELELEADAKVDGVGFTDIEDDCEEKKKKLEFSFTFRFPTFEEFSKSRKENSELSNSDLVLSSKNLEEEVTSEATEILDDQSKEKSIDDGEDTETTNEATNLIEETCDHDLFNRVHFDYSYNDDGFLGDEDFGDEFKVDADDDVDDENLEYSSGEMSYDFGEEDSDIMDELSKLEGELLERDLEHDPEAMTSQFLSEQDFYEDSEKPMNDSYDSEKLKFKEETTCEFEDSNKLETLWEHQELIEQLKMELRKVKATGLPTILEESESPKITEDLKPWKIDDKFQREDCMDELHNFYKSYRERMRKFDIFNYQKMYAIGFLQLKDPLRPISSSKTSGPTLKSLVSQNFWQFKHKGSVNEPMIEFMKELQSDLEVVYVGQMCLSWELLHWQYGKALDLWDSDPRGIHRYNEVAGEFQQFQVLMQRFIEDEHFQGPRVQNYIKCRCLLRNLLQVPVIREDNLKDKRKGKRGERAEYVITIDMMVEIIEESIRIFWRFVRADKDCSSAISKGHKGAPAQLQNPGDLELLLEIKKILYKKERKLKDLVRGGSCILRRFRKCREDDTDHVLYFFSQVDMKLVSRVLNMTRITTDQLKWCHSKLSRISFENRKIQVEPSFLLFPC